MEKRRNHKSICNRLLAMAVAFALILGLCPAVGGKVKAEEEAENVWTWAGIQDKINQAAQSETKAVSVKLIEDVAAGDSATAIRVTEGVTATIDLNGHTLDRGLSNTAAGEGVEGGAVIIVEDGNLIINDSRGKDDYRDDTGKITGGNSSISDDEHQYYNEGAITVQKGNLTINGGLITGNKGSNGVICFLGTCFTMNGGEISGNTYMYGDAIKTNFNEVVMNGGIIRDNTTDSFGHGINNVLSLGKTGSEFTRFTYKGGTISGDQAAVEVFGFEEDILNINDNLIIMADSQNSNGSTATEVSKEDLISNINSYKYISAVYQYPISNWSELYSALNSEEKDMLIKLTGDCVWDASVNSGEVPLRIDKGKKVTVDLNGHVIDRNLNEVAASGYAIEVVNESELVINDSHPESDHAGKYIWYKPDDTEMAVIGGIITGGFNSGYQGGGISVCAKSAFTLNGGTIFHNLCLNDNGEGGGVYNVASDFTMNGGAIISNFATLNGGGVYNYGGTFNLNDGEIIDNTATYGGGCYTYMSSLNMKNGEVVYNKATENGGGMYFKNSGARVFTVEEGLFYMNSAALGGGIYMGENTELVLEDCNIAENEGYGLYAAEGIRNLSIGTSTACPIIYKNTISEKPGNVYLGKGVKIDASGYTTGQIGITSDSENELPYEFTTGASYESVEDIFKSDNDDYMLRVSENSQAELYKPKEFADTDFTIGNVETEYDGDVYTISVATATEASEGAEILYAYNEEGTQPESDDDYSEDLPEFSDVGTYTIFFMAKKADYKNYYNQGTVKITKKTIGYEWSEETEYPFDGSVKCPTATLTDAVEGDDVSLEITVYDEDEESVEPVYPGEYTAKVTGLFGDDANNYQIPEEETDKEYEITPGEIDFEVEGYEADFDDDTHGITVTVSEPEDATITYAEGTDDKTVPADDKFKEANPEFLNADTYYVWYRIEKENYETVTGCEKVIINEAEMDVTAEGFEGDYDEDEHSITVTVKSPAETIISYAIGEDAETQPDDDEFGDDNPTFTDAGTYYVWYMVEKANYETVVGCETVVIDEAEIDYEEADDIETVYDGSEYSIEVTDIDPEDAVITYAKGSDDKTQPEDSKFEETNPACVKAGTYYVWYKIAKKNYETVYDVATVTINKKTVAIEWSDDVEFTYDGENHSPTASFADGSIIEGDTCGLQLFGVSKEVGEHTASVSRLTGDDAKNYALPEFSDRSKKYEIVPIVVAIDWSDDNEFDYDGEAHIPTAVVDEDSLLDGESVELIVEAFEIVNGNESTDASDSINAGQYVARVKDFVKDSEEVYKHYALPETGTAFEYKINKKTVTASATDAGKVYGDDNPDEYEYTVEGLVGDDKPEDVFTGELEREAGEDVGEYAIKQGTLAIDQEKEHVNYELEDEDFTEGTFTISEKELTVKWDELTFTYNGEEQLPTATAKGLVGEDVIGLEVALSEDYDESKDADSYKAKVIGITGEKSGNYMLPAEVETEFTIEPAGVELEWSDTEFTYDGKEHAPTATVKKESLFGDDTCNVTVTGAKTDAGTYWAYAAKDTDNSNYIVVPGSETNKQQFEIKRAAQTITAKNITISGGTTAEINAKASAGGALSYKVKSGDDIISVDEVGVITALKKGNAVVTITAGATRNYAEATKDINVKVTNTIYTVTFNANGHGKAPETQKVVAGKKAKKPEEPKATGYALYGWFTEKACKTEYNFNKPVNSNIVLYAKWVRVIDMYRLYNPNSGEHFYTASSAERNELRSAGWKYEGVAWRAPEKSKTPVYRVYNPNAGDHHYTISSKEKDQLVAAGWKDEGIGWYSDDAKTVPIYRVYNPNATTGSHHFTTSANEVKDLVKAGWKDEGTAWFGR